MLRRVAAILSLFVDVNLYVECRSLELPRHPSETRIWKQEPECQCRRPLL